MRMCLRAVTACAALLLAAALSPGAAQEPKPAEKAAPTAQPSAAERQKLLDAARQIMTAQTYCAFITVDADGRPQVRTVNPFPPEEDMTVWFATGIQTRKVAGIRANPHVAVYYADHKNATGYVQLTGRAVLVSDKAEIERHRRAYWTQAFPGDKNLVLVKVIPERLDVVNYAAGVNGDKVTWRSPSIELGPKKLTSKRRRARAGRGPGDGCFTSPAGSACLSPGPPTRPGHSRAPTHPVRRRAPSRPLP